MSDAAGKSTLWVFSVMFAAVVAVAAVMKYEAAYAAPDVQVENAYVRVTIPGRPAAGYVTLRNAGSSADTLVSASSPMAGKIELHSMTMDNGVMKMRQVDKIDVPAKGAAELEPGGVHLMIFGLKEGVEAGDTVPLTLTFGTAGGVEADFRVEAIGAKSGKTGDGHENHENREHHKN